MATPPSAVGSLVSGWWEKLIPTLTTMMWSLAFDSKGGASVARRIANSDVVSFPPVQRGVEHANQRHAGIGGEEVFLAPRGRVEDTGFDLENAIGRFDGAGAFDAVAG